MARLRRIASALLPILAFCLYLVLAARDAEQTSSSREEVLFAANIRVSKPMPPALLVPAAKTELAPAVVAPLPIAPGESPDTKAESLRENEATTEKTTAKAIPSRRKVWAVVTAYCPCSRCCGAWADGRTSLGLSAWKPGIAADPRAIPYGTRVYVEGYGEAVVDDTGGILRRTWRRKGQIHLDVRMTYHWEARQWGRREMWVEIIEEKD